MDAEYQITYEEKPEDSAWGIIGGGLHAYNMERGGENNFQRLCYVLNAPNGEIAGGVLAEVYWGWLYIDLLWVKEELRGHGYGRRLLQRVEEDARERGARNAYLDTFSFQAPEFYTRQGYKVFGELTDFPPGHRRFFMQKEL